MEDSTSLIECPKCKDLGLDNEVYVSCGFTTSVGIEKYFKNGKYHCHDRNHAKSTWSCSNKHSGIMYSMKSCPATNCNFIGFTEIIVNPDKPEPPPGEQKPNVLEKGVPLSFDTNITSTPLIPIPYLIRSDTVYHNISEDIKGIVKISSPDVSVDLHLTEGQSFEVQMVSGKIIIKPNV